MKNCVSPRLPSLSLGLCVLALLALVLEFSIAAESVEMIADTEELQPSSTLEFRFETPMITAEDVDLSVKAEVAPIQITPAVDGSFTWLS